MRRWWATSRGFRRRRRNRETDAARRKDFWERKRSESRGDLNQIASKKSRGVELPEVAHRQIVSRKNPREDASKAGRRRGKMTSRRTRAPPNSDSEEAPRVYLGDGRGAKPGTPRATRDANCILRHRVRLGRGRLGYVRPSDGYCEDLEKFSFRPRWKIVITLDSTIVVRCSQRLIHCSVRIGRLKRVVSCLVLI